MLCFFKYFLAFWKQDVLIKTFFFTDINSYTIIIWKSDSVKTKNNNEKKVYWKLN